MVGAGVEPGHLLRDMQMLLVPLAGAGEPLAAIALSTGFVSGRHIFYGLGFPLERVRGRALTRLYAVHAITDEVYALLAARDRRAMSGRYLVGVEAISHTAWVSARPSGHWPERRWPPRWVSASSYSVRAHVAVRGPGH